MLAASHRAAERQDWVLAGRLAAVAAADGKEHSAALTLADALNHQGRHEEALAALGDWRGTGDNEMARVAVLRAYILYWGLSRTDDADGTLAGAEAGDRRHVEPGLGGGHPGRPADVPGAPGGGRRPHPARPRTDRPVAPRRGRLPDRPLPRPGLVGPPGGGRRGRRVLPSTRLLDADDAPVSVRWNVLARLSAYRLAGQLDKMEDLANAEYEQALHLHNPEAQGVTAGALGWVCLARGQLASAVQHFRESVAVLEKVDWTAVRSQSLTGLTEALALAGDPDGAAAALAEAGYDGRPTTRWVWPRVVISSAWVSAARGELSRAVEQFLTAASEARSTGQVAFEMLALHSAARLGETQVADRLMELTSWVQGPLIHRAAAQAAAMAAGSGADLDRAAEGWAALTMWLHAAECAAMASRAHLLAGVSPAGGRLVEPGAGVPRPLRRSAPARPRRDPGRADPDQAGAGSGAAGPDGPFQPGHRRAAVPVRAHRRQPSGPHLPQARHHQPAGTGRGPGNVAAPTG